MKMAVDDGAGLTLAVAGGPSRRWNRKRPRGAVSHWRGSI